MARTEFSSLAAKDGGSKRLYKNSKYVFTRFEGPALYASTAGVSAIPSVADAGINNWLVDGELFNYRLEQAFAGTAPQPKQTIEGYHLQLDAADNDGVSVDLGRVIAPANSVVNSYSKGAFTIGTDPAFFLRVKLDVATVASADQIAVGFNVGAYAADGLINTHTDMAMINIDNGDLKLETRLNSAGDAAVDTTQNVADAGQVTLEVRVSDSGQVKFLIDGVAPTVDVTGFTFDSADVVHACVMLLTDAAGDPVVTLLEWESGHLSARGLDGISDLNDVVQTA